jgi:hypothetical protein
MNLKQLVKLTICVILISLATELFPETNRNSETLQRIRDLLAVALAVDYDARSEMKNEC